MSENNTNPNDRNADKSSIEIKTLVRKLHPKRGNHKDRIRQLNKFRNYVIGPSSARSSTIKPPEFYDDDLPLLWLGSAAPAVYLEEVNDDLLAMGIYGLLQACGAPSDDHDGTLKRSARHAMNVLKWLLVDWKEGKNEVSSRNLFCRSFLSLEVKHYHHMQLDLHCIGDDRGGAKEDACHILVLILTSHTSEDGEANKPLMMEDLLQSAKAQQEFELWTARHCTGTTQDAIKKNAASRQAELALQHRQDALATKAHASDWGAAAADHDDDHPGGGGGGPTGHAEKGGPSSSGARGGTTGGDHSDRDRDDASDASDDDEDDYDDYYADEADDVVGAMRKRNRQLRKQLKLAEGRGDIERRMRGSGGIATRWEDSQVAREQRARASAAAAARARQLHDTVRDSQQAAHEMMEREEERAKVLGKDPIGIVKTDDFDLSTVETTQAQQMERALAELQEDAQKVESSGNEKLIKKATGKKESIEAFIERLGGLEAMENATTLQHSILPTNPKFDPLLFLTLVHRKTKYETLKGSMDKLSSAYTYHAHDWKLPMVARFQTHPVPCSFFHPFRQDGEPGGAAPELGPDQLPPLRPMRRGLRAVPEELGERGRPRPQREDRQARGDRRVVRLPGQEVLQAAAGQHERGAEGPVGHHRAAAHRSHPASPRADAAAH
jgi:Exocyst complex component Sec5